MTQSSGTGRPPFSPIVDKERSLTRLPTPFSARSFDPFAVTLQQFKDEYELLEILDRGTFSLVRKAMIRSTGELVAVKVGSWIIEDDAGDRLASAPHPSTH